MTTMATGSQVMTAEELIELPRGRWRHELVRGGLRQMPLAGHQHGEVAARVLFTVGPFVQQARLGKTYAAETGFLIARDPDTVRGPDVAFVSNETLSRIALSPQGYFPGAPDLAIEVTSPSDRRRYVDEKVAAWLEAGSQVVVVLDPRRKTGAVHRRGGQVRLLSATDQVTLPDLLPGWSLNLAETFG
jgi:Uma2 family endonuclease